MKKIYLLLILIIGICNYAFADIDVLWSQTYGGTNSDVTNSFCITAEGDFILAGYTNSFGSGNSDLNIIKTDPSGNEIWNQVYGDTGWENANSVCNAVDGEGYVSAGYTTSSQSNSFDVYIVKTSEYGDLVWEKTFGGDEFDIAESICQTSDGYLICGYTNSYGMGEDDVYLIKLNANGDSLWSKTIGCEKSDMGHSVKPIGNGQYIITGSTGLYDIPIPGSDGRNREVYVIKIDEEGVVLAENTYWTMDTHQNSFDTGYEVCEAIGGGFYIVGCTSQHFEELMDICLLKVDSNLNEIWKTNLEIDGFYDFGYSICEIEQTGNVAICGSYKADDNLKANLFCMLVDYNGIEIERVELGDVGSECGNKIMQAEDGSLIIAGYTSSLGAGKNDAYLIKLDIGQTNEINEEQIPLPDDSLYNYPNPFNPTTNISFSTPEFTKNTEIKIYNIRGQLVDEIKIFNEQTSVKWNAEGMPSGIYFYKLNFENSPMKKMLLLK